MKKNVMKLVWIIVAAVSVGAVLAGCSDEPAEINLADNPEQREEVFSQILNNQELYYEFLGEVRENTTTMEWTAGDAEYARDLFREESMNRMREANPGMDTVMMENMMNRMERDTAFGREFMRRMEDRRLFHGDVMR